ncbi:MAG TPA: hypothetical protein VFJ85_18815 [Acidimicrobiales bacterium]|nr:hypothetical protein [Acidimicrobiales bacterium]
MNSSVLGMAATPTGDGVWLVASDGGIFSFGDARFFGSTGAIHLNKPIVNVAAAPPRLRLLAGCVRRRRLRLRLGVIRRRRPDRQPLHHRSPAAGDPSFVRRIDPPKLGATG